MASRCRRRARRGGREYLVIHHTDCGMLTFSNDDLRTSSPTRRAADASDIDFLPFSDLADSFREDMERIRQSPLIPDDITVTGYIYDVNTGGLAPVED